jgi:hypothetical protein
MITVLADGVTRLADNSFGDNLGDGVAGPVGLLIIVLLAVATALLIRNMNKHLKRLPESFPDPRAAARAADQGESVDDSQLAAAQVVTAPSDDSTTSPS